jgi:hypothetical protein
MHTGPSHLSVTQQPRTGLLPPRPLRGRCVTVALGTNQNGGESPSPLGGDDGHNDEDMVVVS